MVPHKWLRKSTHLHKTDKSINVSKVAWSFLLDSIKFKSNQTETICCQTCFFLFSFFCIWCIYRTQRDIDNPPHINNTHTSLTSIRLFLICSHYVSVLFHNEIFHSKGYYGSAIFCIDNQVTREIFDGNWITMPELWLKRYTQRRCHMK